MFSSWHNETMLLIYLTSWKNVDAECISEMFTDNIQYVLVETLALLNFLCLCLDAASTWLWLKKDCGFGLIQKRLQ